MCRRTATFHLVLLFAELAWGKAVGVPVGVSVGTPVDAEEPLWMLMGPDGTPFQDKLLTRLRNQRMDSVMTNAIEESLLAAAKTMLAQNLIPRFKIPRGNLSDLTNPHWEILYFLQHGHFPVVTEKKLKNSTVSLSERLRSIRSIINRSDDRLNLWLAMAADDLGGENGLGYSATPEGLDLSLFDPDVFFTFDGPLGAFFATREEAEELVREYERRHGEIVEGAAGPPASDNEESNFLDGLTLALKAAPPDPRPLRKRDGILKYFLDRAHKTPPSEDAQAAWMKTFLVDHDPSWVRGRMKAAKPHVVQRSDAADSRALYSSVGGAISARSGGGASEGTGGGGGGATGGDDSSSQGGPRRKFQTQGW